MEDHARLGAEDSGPACGVFEGSVTRGVRTAQPGELRTPQLPAWPFRSARLSRLPDHSGAAAFAPP